MAAEIRKIYINEMIDIIVEAYLKNPRQNIGFRGPPGIGKTEGIYQAAEIIRKTYPDFFVKVNILSQMDSVDFRMPWVDSNNQYRFLPAQDWSFPPDAKGIVFLDEAANANSDVLKAVQQCMSDRKLGDIVFSDGIMFIIASNNKEDRAGANSIPTAFANRVEWHQVQADHESWLQWAYKKGLDVSLTSYIKKFPQCLNNFQADRDVNPTSRSWYKVNDVIGSAFEYDRICGLIGQEYATQFVAWRKLWTQFPEKEDIERDWERAKLPNTMDAQFALTMAMASWATPKNWASMVRYTRRLSLEYQTLFMKEAPRMKPEAQFKGTSEYRQWIVDNQKNLI